MSEYASFLLNKRFVTMDMTKYLLVIDTQDAIAALKATFSAVKSGLQRLLENVC